MPNGSPFYAASVSGEAVRQGEIISSLRQYVISQESIAAGGDPVFRVVTHPLAIVLSQECDLDLEFRSRNQIRFANGTIPDINTQIPNILFCEVFRIEELRSRSDINSGIWNQIKGIITNGISTYMRSRPPKMPSDKVFPSLLLIFAGISHCLLLKCMQH